MRPDDHPDSTCHVSPNASGSPANLVPGDDAFDLVIAADCPRHRRRTVAGKKLPVGVLTLTAEECHDAVITR